MPPMRDNLREFWEGLDLNKKKIAQGFVWVGLFAFFGKFAGAAKEMAIAWRYGISSEVDAYVFLFSLINVPISIWFSVLAVVLVPLVAENLQEKNTRLYKFQRELFGIALAVGVVLLLISWFLIPIIMESSKLGMSKQVITDVNQMVVGLSLVAPIGIMISVLSAWMLAYGRHTNTLFEAVPAIIILGFVLVLPAGVDQPLVWGTVFGFGLHLVLLAAALNFKGNLNYQIPRFSFSSPIWSGFWGAAGVIAIGQGLIALSGVIDQLFAARLGDGALSTLSFSGRILALILGIGAMAIARATLPVFSKLNVDSPGNTITLAWFWGKIMLIFGIGVSLLFWACAPTLVKILFERGAFTAADTVEVYRVLRASLYQIPFYFSGLVFYSLFSSMQRYKVVACVLAISISIKCIIIVPLASQFGLAGIQVSNAAMYFFFVVLQIIVLKLNFLEN